jgi:hypothetical protein
MKLNVGAGQFPLKGFVNIDPDPSTPADVHLDVPPFPYADASAEEVYLGHVFEHFLPFRAKELLAECLRVLIPGGRLGVVVPDTRAIMRRWLDGPATVVEMPRGSFWDMSDLDQVCGVFLYSVIQPSHHLWSYDLDTLGRALTRAGFVNLQPIDRFRDPRIQVGAWWGCGWDAFKPV